MQAALHARLATLPDQTRELPTVAAVAGRDLDPRLLADAAERGAQDVHATLAAAVGLPHRRVAP